MNKEKVLNVASIVICHCRSNQIYSRIRESDFLIVKLVFVPPLSCLHALEAEHNEPIDDMTKIHSRTLAIILAQMATSFLPVSTQGLLATAQPI